MAFATYRDSEHFFLNGIEIRGVQNVQLDYGINAVPLEYVGLQTVDYLPDGPQTAKLTFNSYLLGADPIISLTGNSHSNGYILKSRGHTVDNVGFSGAFLSSYGARFAVGAIPEINGTFDVYGNAGRLPVEEATAHFAIISGNALPTLHPSSPGDLVLTLDGFSPERVYSCDININVRRNIVYAVGSRYFVRSDLVYPMEAILNFGLTREGYMAWHMRRYPRERKTTNVSLTVLDSRTKNVLTTYKFDNLLLFSERTTANVTEKGLVNLEYRTYIGNPERKKSNRMHHSISGTAKIKRIGQDTFEQYANFQDFHLNRGIGWDDEWALINSRYGLGLLAYEPFDYPTGQAINLNSGSWWSGAWSIVNDPIYRLGFLGYDHFEWYQEGSGQINSLDSGSWWSGAWSIGQNIRPEAPFLGVVAYDAFSQYFTGAIVPGFGYRGGDNWTTRWAFVDDISDSPFLGLRGYDGFEDYLEGYASGLSSGTGWDGIWSTA